MREISTIELYAAVHELEKFSSYYIEKVYELPGMRFRIRLGKSGADQANILIIPGKVLGITDQIELVESPTNFAVALRKRRMNSQIDAIKLYNYDRIVSIEMHKGPVKANLIIEMFNNGNVILADDKMNILLAYERREYSDRNIAHGQQYAPPKNKPITIEDIYDIKRLESKLEALAGSSPGTGIAKLLGSSLNIGSLYAENSIMECKYATGQKAGEMQKEQLHKIAERLNALTHFMESPKPRIYADAGKAADYAICDIKKYELLERNDFDTVSAMLNAFYSAAAEPARVQESRKSLELKASIRKQQEIIEKAQADMEAHKRIAEAIFNNMQLINQLVRKASEMKRFTKEELQEMFPSIKISKVDLKEKSISIEI